MRRDISWRMAGGSMKCPSTPRMGPARVIRIEHPHAILPDELEGHDLQPGERLLFRTQNSERCWNTDQFVEDFVYISAAAAQFLVDRQVRTVGVDYLSVGGFVYDGVETHQILLSAGLWVIEGLNLAAVEPGAYELICLPLRTAGADGAPARAILRQVLKERIINQCQEELHYCRWSGWRCVVCGAAAQVG